MIIEFSETMTWLKQIGKPPPTARGMHLRHVNLAAVRVTVISVISGGQKSRIFIRWPTPRVTYK